MNSQSPYVKQRTQPLVVAMAGEGQLAALVRAELARDGCLAVAEFDATPRLAVSRAAASRAAASRAAASGTSAADFALVVYCADGPPPDTADIVRAAREMGRTLVAGRLTRDGGRVMVAGSIRDPAVGCPACIECHEQDRAGSVAAAAEQIDVAAARIDAALVAQLVALAVCSTLEASWGRRPIDRVATVVDLARSTVTTEPVAPHPSCRACYPADAVAGDGRDRGRAPDVYARDRPVPEITAHLSALRPLAAGRFGLFEPPHARTVRERHAIHRFFRRRGVEPQGHPLAEAHSFRVVRRTTARGAERADVAAGLAFDDPGRAEALALLEGVERVFALERRPREGTVRASLREVEGEAIDPRDLACYTAEQYEQAEFPLQRFDADAPIDWMRGIDLAAGGTPVLVPVDAVFGPQGPERILQATSNGAACHASATHAILNGLYEVVERDALMVAWLNRLSLPRIVLDPAAPDPGSLRTTLASLGFTLDYVDLTTDLDIPVLLAVLRDEHDADLVLLNMVASQDHDARVQKLHRELAQFLYPRLIDSRAYVPGGVHHDDPDAVHSFADHLAFYQSASRHPLLSFLTASQETRVLPRTLASPSISDAVSELNDLVGRLSARGYRTIVVDCTAPLLRERGLHAVKVLVPGLQPLSAGHRFRPLGGERLLGVAHRMGLADGPRRPDELNPWPHPFW